jgi:hypothetical protein
MQFPDVPSIEDFQSEEWIAAHPGPAMYIQHFEAQVSVDQIGVLRTGMRKLPSLSHFHMAPQFMDSRPEAQRRMAGKDILLLRENGESCSLYRVGDQFVVIQHG